MSIFKAFFGYTKHEITKILGQSLEISPRIILQITIYGGFMKNFLILIIALSFCLSGCNNNNETQNTQQENTSYNYTASRTTTVDEEPIPSLETNIATFSTKIYIKESARQHNISITCSKLNGTIVKSRRNFFIL